MAYIDFYRGGKQYRAILGECGITPNGFIEVERYNYIVVNWSYATISAQGSSLQDLFNVNNLDWNNPPDTAPTGKKGYLFKNEVNTLQIFIEKTQDNNINWKGSVVAGGDVIETTYATNEPTLTFHIFNTKYNQPLLSLSYTNVSNVPASQPPIMNTGLNPLNNEVQLLRATVLYNNEKINVYGLCNPLTYQAYKIFNGNSLYPTGDNTQTTLSGTILVNKGIMLRQGFRGTHVYTNVNNNGWNETSGGTINGMKTVPITKVIAYFSNFFESNLKAFTDLIPDNNDEGGYPNDPNPSDDDPSNPDDPNKPSGGDGDGDKTSDEILDDITPTLNVTGIITMYKLTTDLLNNLGKDLWSDNFMNTILKITQSPIDSIIGVKLYNFSIPSGNLKTVYLGNYKSNITAPTIQNSIVVLDMSSINVNEFFGDFKDYNPFTKISIYLPFIGVIDLNTNEIMNSRLSLKYKINILTGNCIASLTVSKQIDETNLNSVLYQFNGTCDIELPLSAASANTMIYGRLSQIQSIATAVNRIGHNYKDGFSESNVQNGINATANVLKNEIDANHLDVTRTGNLTGSNGSLGILTPYLIIERVIPNYPTIYAKNIGLPIDRALKLSNLNGYAEIESIFISNFTGTQNEYDELIYLLQTGVVF